MRFINDPWSVESRHSGASSATGERRSANVIFDIKAYFRTRTDYGRYDAVPLRTNRNITGREELLIELGAVLYTAKNRYGAVSFMIVHLLQAKGNIFESHYTLIFLTGSGGKRKPLVGDVSKGCVILSFPAFTSRSPLPAARHKRLRAALFGNSKSGKARRSTSTARREVRGLKQLGVK